MFDLATFYWFEGHDHHQPVGCTAALWPTPKATNTRLPPNGAVINWSLRSVFVPFNTAPHRAHVVHDVQTYAKKFESEFLLLNLNCWMYLSWTLYTLWVGVSINRLDSMRMMFLTIHVFFIRKVHLRLIQLPFRVIQNFHYQSSVMAWI